MRQFEELSFNQLVDRLALTTEKYTKVLNDSRYSDEHTLLRDEIQELIKEIDYRRNGEQTLSSNPIFPGHQFLFIKDL